MSIFLGKNKGNFAIAKLQSWSIVLIVSEIALLNEKCIVLIIAR